MRPKPKSDQNQQVNGNPTRKNATQKRNAKLPEERSYLEELSKQPVDFSVTFCIVMHMASQQPIKCLSHSGVAGYGQQDS